MCSSALLGFAKNSLNLSNLLQILSSDSPRIQKFDPV